MGEWVRPTDRPPREIRAARSTDAIEVYQAYPESIASAALEAQRFVPPFRVERMTWIKPSFLWMMYRSGWGQKPGQERILRVTLRRDAFDWMLEHAVLSHFVGDVHGTRDEWAAAVRSTPVVVQWDPERDTSLTALPWRTIQIGLRGEAVRRYTTEAIVTITDVTAIARALKDAVASGDPDAVTPLLPDEQPYPVAPDVARRLRMST